MAGVRGRLGEIDEALGALARWDRFTWEGQLPDIAKVTFRVEL